ncbi:MAG: hypothetical protein H6721_13730 [Sandaracinus sp.]|nr:hypothetical protein [Sandaracinus sp.]
MKHFVGLVALAVLAASCGDDGAFSGPVVVDLTADRPPARLSEWRLLTLRDGHVVYNDRVVPYDLATPLFSDYSLKDRAIYLPEGATIAYADEGVLDFPVGTVIVKSFSIAPDLRSPDVDRRVLETRVLVRHADGWRTWPYRWNDTQTDADFTPAGAVIELSFVDTDGAAREASYLVPNRNQCTSCHERQTTPGGMDTVVTPIGPNARNLRGVPATEGEGDVLDHLASIGWLTGLTEGDAAVDWRAIERDGVAGLSFEELDRAARDYLDVNCAHCHNPSGVQGQTSQLFLNHDNEDLFRLGFCKRPGSAGAGTGGLTFDIVPGDPDQSILVFRVETEEVGAMMPLLGRSVTHTRGAELLRAWVAAMEPMACE